ncbi:hypothetical protein AB0K16_20460 [Nonomuraea jabiensis]|uniref:hypothetical protein n=1 Tax=Nonomuraea jabiensis TaxID=882448 RepID=UPI00343BF12F
MSHQDETILFRNTMRITEGHLEDFRNAIARAVKFAQQHGPQLMVQTFVDETRMLAHSFQLYRDSDAVFGEPDGEVAAGLRLSFGEQIPLTFSPRIAGFLRFGGEPRA